MKKKQGGGWFRERPSTLESSEGLQASRFTPAGLLTTPTLGLGAVSVPLTEASAHCVGNIDSVVVKALISRDVGEHATEDFPRCSIRGQRQCGDRLSIYLPFRCLHKSLVSSAVLHAGIYPMYPWARPGLA